MTLSWTDIKNNSLRYILIKEGEMCVFDINILEDIRKRADGISYQCMSQQRYLDQESLVTALDHVCRALSMFAEIEIQRLKNENIAYDPQSYIKGRLGIAHKVMNRAIKDDTFSA